MDGGFGTVAHAGVPAPPPRIPQSAPAIQSIGRKRDDPHIRTCRYCIPDRCLVAFRRSCKDWFLYPRNCTANKRANTTYRHRQRQPLSRGAETSACCRILFGFPACQSAEQSIGNTFRDSNYTAIDQRECLFFQDGFSYTWKTLYRKIRPSFKSGSKHKNMCSRVHPGQSPGYPGIEAECTIMPESNNQVRRRCPLRIQRFGQSIHGHIAEFFCANDTGRL